MQGVIRDRGGWARAIRSSSLSSNRIVRRVWRLSWTNMSIFCRRETRDESRSPGQNCRSQDSCEHPAPDNTPDEYSSRVLWEWIIDGSLVHEDRV